MKAVIYHGPGKVSVVERRRPSLRAGSIRIKVSYASLCGTDMHFFSGEWSARHGIILGHDASGIIEDSGRHAAPEFQEWCGRCAYCLEGKENLCTAAVYRGFEKDGFMAGELSLHDGSVYLLPDTLPLREAACLEPAALALHTIDVMKPKRNGYVAVIGQGGVGLCMTQAAKLRGCRVIAADLLEHRLDVASEMGADHTVNVSEATDAASRISGIAGSAPLTVIEAGGTDSSVRLALKAARPDGSVALVSGAHSGIEPSPETAYTCIVAYTRSDKLNAIRLAASGKLDLGRLVTHTYPVGEAAAALRTMASPASKAIKVLLSF